MTAYKVQPPDDDGRSNWRILLRAVARRFSELIDTGCRLYVRSSIGGTSTVDPEETFAILMSEPRSCRPEQHRATRWRPRRGGHT